MKSISEFVLFLSLGIHQAQIGEINEVAEPPKNPEAEDLRGESQ
jgi:hypothetical protein